LSVRGTLKAYAPSKPWFERAFGQTFQATEKTLFSVV